jgi:hypothetical protein
MAAPAERLLRVGAVWPLPGLGLLALPDGSAPALAGYGLHTALAVTAVLPGGARHAAAATVEEVTRPEVPEEPTRGLLLNFSAALDVPVGTEIWLADAEWDAYAGLR